MKYQIIAIDFDSTIAVETWPDVGELIEGAKETINWLYNKGKTIIIWTCREGAFAEEAMAFLDMHGVKWTYFNHNCPNRINKYGWDSRKIGCDIIIDDKCIFSLGMGPEVDWSMVRETLEMLFEDDE